MSDFKFELSDIPSAGSAERKVTPYDAALEQSRQTGKAIKFRHTFTPEDRKDAESLTKAQNNLSATIRNAARSLFVDENGETVKTARVRFDAVDAKGTAVVTFWVAEPNKRRQP